jgi:hypothetical protein
MAISGKLMYMNSIINMQKKKDDITLKRCHLLKLQSNSVRDLKTLTELMRYFRYHLSSSIFFVETKLSASSL